MKLVLIIKNYNNCWERCFLSCQLGQRKSSESPWRTHLRPSVSVLPCSTTVSQRDSMLSKAHYEVQIWHVSCILLGSAMLILSCFVNRIGKTVYFKLAKEIEKDVFAFSWARDMSIWGIKPYCCLLIIFKGLLYLGYR